MLDFLMIATRSKKKGLIEVYPKFIIKKSSDLMIRGGDFYAIWIEELGLWSTDEEDVIKLVDKELDKYAEDNRQRFDGSVVVLHMWDAESGVIDSWHKYCQKQMRDSFHMLDEKLIFSNSKTNKQDYASKKLPYPLEAGDISAWDTLISTLYTDEERHKIEWAIGSIVSGDSKKIQKFMVLYGSAGTGKSTILNVIQQLFEGYYSVFDAKALGSSSNSFALEAFKTNPLVAIQHDGDLSRIEDNTRLNSLVSHELMTVNEKFKSTYSNRFKCFLFMGTNKPVKITDAKSGLIRRLIDVTPSGNKLSPKEYKSIVKQVGFELGAIAQHCMDVYLDDPGYYDAYIPTSMLGASNDFYNYIIDSYHVFKKEDGTTLKAAWKMYNEYCEEARVAYPYSQRAFKEELKNYFRDYKERFSLDDGTRVRSYYSGFKYDKFENNLDVKKEESPSNNWLEFGQHKSIFDKENANCLAQYASAKETPSKKWDEVKTKLSDIDTSKLHYVAVPENHIVIDFDIKDASGQKNFGLNLEEAKKWPPTYAELSKSGAGIHLHYIYTGDSSKLSRIYDDHIEIKVFNGKSSLRRKLTKCNDLPIAKISSGLPLKGEKMVNFEAIKSEKGLRTLIKKNLEKEIHPGTKPSIDFIYKILEDAYSSGMKYDVSDMSNAIFAFAANSTNQAEYCLKLVNKMHFKSEEPSEPNIDEVASLVFYDIEVFPNLFLVNWKKQGEGNSVVRMINPSPAEIENLIRFNLVGFNCRRYDNHILYARLMGYDNDQLYKLSQRIINKEKDAFFGQAYNISYTDIYDFASAGNKMSLKKLEIEMGIHHQELGLPWDKPVPEERWIEVAEYCDNDVIATEAAFNYLSADWTARQILADIAGLTVNDTTNTLTTKIIFGNDKKPQSQFNYRDMGEVSNEDTLFLIDKNGVIYPTLNDEYTRFNKDGKPVFPGYVYKYGKSTYRGEEVGEGGYVYAEPGMYTDVALLDVASMHPHSVLAENLFGEYTARFQELVDARIAIKHKDWDKARTMLDGKLTKYVQKVIDGEMTSKQLANALKTAINSVYGLTSAKFANPFKDPRNVDNIVAKRGALFMINLKHQVQSRGFTVAHIKTDSIKVPNATPEIIKFIMDYGEMYGYSFEHEATYDRMCLVNDAVYIARYKDADGSKALYGYVPDECESHGGEWTATGAQFAVPYTFKTLFSNEPIEFDDLCETKAVTSALYLDMNEGLPDVSKFEKELSKTISDLDKLKKNGDTLSDLAKKEIDSEVSRLREEISKGHDYHFIGKVGQFCPIKQGCGGGELVREGTNKDGSIKYSSATGAKGYHWLESEVVRMLGKEDDIDKSYYQKMVDDAVDSISQYGDFEWFVSNEQLPLNETQLPSEDDLPWYENTPFDVR